MIISDRRISIIIGKKEVSEVFNIFYIIMKRKFNRTAVRGFRRNRIFTSIGLNIVGGGSLGIGKVERGNNYS